MNKSRIGLLLVAALSVLPASALAAGKAKAEAKASAGKAEAKASVGVGAAADASASTQASGDESGAAAGATEGAAGAEEGNEAETPDTGGGLDDICKIDPEACPKIDFDKEAKKQLGEQIFAVQQIYALRVRRFELNPYWSVSFNDQFVGHNGPGLAINYYIWNSFAVGINGTYFNWFNSDSRFNADVRRSVRVGVPLNEYDWNANFNLTYVPAYGKFAGFGDFIFQYDAYIVAGGGLISTRPIPVFDPDYRNFSYKTKPSGNVGIGLRIFFYRWMAAILELRDYIYQEELENIHGGVDSGPNAGYAQNCRGDAVLTGAGQGHANQAYWICDKKLTNAVQGQIGVSFFLPTTFNYRLPK
jgi:outer membrane beta-barrel protein